MKDQTDLPNKELRSYVKVYAVLSDDNEYEQIGNGFLQIVTDADLLEPQHYIQVIGENSTELILRSHITRRVVFQKQKDTVIIWTDNEQMKFEDLAISFEQPEECDMYWKLICAKIGKNYLQVNGQQKLEMPSVSNLNHILEKSKTSYNLVAYHVINSEKFMSCFWETFAKLKENKEDRPKISLFIKVLKEILSHFDPKIMEIFLKDPNFKEFLQVYKQYMKIDFAKYYQQTQRFSELVPLSQSTSDKIQITMRATFMRDSVIDLANDITMENMLNGLIKDNQIDIIGAIIQQNVIQKAMTLYAEAKTKTIADVNDLSERMINFFLQSLSMSKMLHSEKTKTRFMDTFYESGIFGVFIEMLNKNFFKVLEILGYVSNHNQSRFFTFYKENFRNDPNESLNRIISKQFAENPQEEFAEKTISFFDAMATSLTTNRENFDFFHGTFIVSVFNCCKYPVRILSLIIFCMERLQNIKGIINQIVRTDYLQKIIQMINRGEATKIHIISVLKILRMILILNKKENSLKPDSEIEMQKKISDYIIESGVFDFSLDYLKRNWRKNNILTSSVLESLKIISQMKDYNGFVQKVQKYDFGGVEISRLTKYLNLIKNISSPVPVEGTVEVDSYDKLKKRNHKYILEEEEEEMYLLSDQGQSAKTEQQTNEQSEVIFQTEQKAKSDAEQLAALIKMKEQISRAEETKNRQELEQFSNRKGNKKVKKQAEVGECIFTIKFLDQVEGEQKVIEQ